MIWDVADALKYSQVVHVLSNVLYSLCIGNVLFVHLSMRDLLRHQVYYTGGTTVSGGVIASWHLKHFESISSLSQDARTSRASLAGYGNDAHIAGLSDDRL